MSTSASLKYCEVLSSDISLTTDGREETNDWIPFASRNLQVQFEEKNAPLIGACKKKTYVKSEKLLWLLSVTFLIDYPAPASLKPTSSFQKPSMTADKYDNTVGDRLTNTFKKDFLCLDNEHIFGEREREREREDAQLIMRHEDELTIEELQEILNEEHQETQQNVSPSEQEEDETGPMPTSAIKDLLKKWEAVRAKWS
ncbi:hypothetical protein TNCV_534841 [Trichonephila clavipes]|nr:hypothetical protein TNCV_534841 [Trichonephila clavipes]